MAKQSGLGDKLLIDGYDVSGDIGSLSSISSTAAPFEVTAIDKSAIERIPGRVDGMLGFTAFFNDAANREHAVFKAKGGGANRVCCWLRGGTIGKGGYGIVAKQQNYDPSRPADGSLTIDVQAIGAAYGGEFADQLTGGLRTDTGAANGASLDNLVATTRGLSAYLQVTAFAGTDATVRIQESSDDAVGDPFANVTGGGFTQVTVAPTAERIVTSVTLSVERYLRAVTVTTGGFTSLTFSVLVFRSPVA